MTRLLQYAVIIILIAGHFVVGIPCGAVLQRHVGEWLGIENASAYPVMRYLLAAIDIPPLTLAVWLLFRNSPKEQWVLPTAFVFVCASASLLLTGGKTIDYTISVIILGTLTVFALTLGSRSLSSSSPS